MNFNRAGEIMYCDWLRAAMFALIFLFALRITFCAGIITE